MLSRGMGSDWINREEERLKTSLSKAGGIRVLKSRERSLIWESERRGLIREGTGV